MARAIWINVNTKRVYKTEICSIFDDAIKNWRSQNISFYLKISLVVIYPWQVSWFHTWKIIHTIYNSCETTKVVNLPSSSSKKTQNNPLKMGLTFLINSFSKICETLVCRIFNKCFVYCAYIPSNKKAKGFWWKAEYH